jgi:hypothetical protein
VGGRYRPAPGFFGAGAGRAGVTVGIGVGAIWRPDSAGLVAGVGAGRFPADGAAPACLVGVGAAPGALGAGVAAGAPGVAAGAAGAGARPGFGSASSTEAPDGLPPVPTTVTLRDGW